MNQTALAAAFSAAGLEPRDIRLLTELSRFFNTGGSEQRLEELIKLAIERLRAAGQRRRAGDGQMNNAGGVQPSPAGGHAEDSREGHSTIAAGGTATLSPARRTAMLGTMHTVAVTVLDTYRIDGRSIGDWTVAEALTAGRQKTAEAYVLFTLARKCRNADPTAKLREVVKVEEVQEAIQAAAEAADAA